MELSFRPFVAEDLEALRELTKNVFGGNDYLASMGLELLAAPDIVFYVIVAPSLPFAGVTLTQLCDHGSTAFFFGIRIADQLRGQGLGAAALRLQTAKAWEMGVQRIRWTRNSTNPATARMAQQLSFTEIMLHPIIRIQEQLPAFFRHVADLPDNPCRLRELSVAELKQIWAGLGEEKRKTMCKCGTVILPSWKLSLVEHLGEEYRVMGEFDDKGEMKGFSVRGEGRNSSLGRLKSLYLSDFCSFKSHVESQLPKDCRDVEIYTPMARKQEFDQQDLYGFNIPFYKDVIVSSVELLKSDSE